MDALGSLSTFYSIATSEFHCAWNKTNTTTNNNNDDNNVYSKGKLN